MGTVSVITAIFNESLDWFRECAQSISIQGTELEWLVIDDGSSMEHTFKYMDIVVNVSPRVQVTYIKLNNNSGLSVARNYGIRIAKGDWFVVLDSDDRLAENTIKTIRKINSDFGLVCFDSLYFYDTSKEYRSISKFYNLFKQYGKSVLCPFLWFDFYYHGIIARREILKRIGGYRGKLRVGEDQDILLRAIDYLNKDQIIFITQLGYEYRNNPNGICATQWKEVRKNYETTMLESANRRGGHFLGCRYTGANIIDDALIDCYEYKLFDGTWVNWDSYKELNTI